MRSRGDEQKDEKGQRGIIQKREKACAQRREREWKRVWFVLVRERDRQRRRLSESARTS